MTAPAAAAPEPGPLHPTGGGGDRTQLYNVQNSPFLELRCPFTAYEALKMVLLLPLLLPRVLVGVGAIALIAAINSCVAWNWPVDRPLTPWRRRLVLASKELVFVVFTMIGFRVRVRGREHIAAAERLGAVAVFNHAAWLDAFIAVWLMAPSGVAKSNNAHLPVIKHAVRALQTVYIPDSKLHRAGAHGAGQQGLQAEAAAPEEARPPNAFLVTSRVTDVLKQRVEDPQYCKLGGYPMLVMAPEGTCSDGTCLLEFRTGAFSLGRPILPICLHYKWRGLNPSWTIIPELFHFVRLMCQFVNRLDVRSCGGGGEGARGGGGVGWGVRAPESVRGGGTLFGQEHVPSARTLLSAGGVGAAANCFLQVTPAA